MLLNELNFYVFYWNPGSCQSHARFAAKPNNMNESPFCRVFAGPTLAGAIADVVAVRMDFAVS